MTCWLVFVMGVKRSITIGVSQHPCLLPLQLNQLKEGVVAGGALKTRLNHVVLMPLNQWHRRGGADSG